MNATFLYEKDKSREISLFVFADVYYVMQK